MWNTSSGLFRGEFYGPIGNHRAHRQTVNGEYCNVAGGNVDSAGQYWVRATFVKVMRNASGWIGQIFWLVITCITRPREVGRTSDSHNSRTARQICSAQRNLIDFSLYLVFIDCLGECQDSTDHPDRFPFTQHLHFFKTVCAQHGDRLEKSTVSQSTPTKNSTVRVWPRTLVMNANCTPTGTATSHSH